jgi:hypothetical protein
MRARAVLAIGRLIVTHNVGIINRRIGLRLNLRVFATRDGAMWLSVFLRDRQGRWRASLIFESAFGAAALAIVPQPPRDLFCFRNFRRAVSLGSPENSDYIAR